MSVGPGIKPGTFWLAVRHGNRCANEVVNIINIIVGPIWYPFFGSSNKVYYYTKKYGSQFKAFLQLSKEYSTDILGINLGTELLVVFYGEKNFREVTQDERFEGRPNNFFMKMRCFGERAGVSLVDGRLWKIHRKFTMMQLRNAGFGKGPMERDIQKSAHNLVKWISEQEIKSLCPKDFLPLVVVNVLWKCAAGETIPVEKFLYLQGLLQRRGNIFNLTGGLLNRAPWIRHLLPEYSGYNMLVEVNRQISVIVQESIQKHKRKEIEGNDFVYAFLEEMAQGHETFTDHQLMVTLIDIILAGSATTSHAMEFAILQVLRDPRVQAELQKEVDCVLEGRMVRWNDTTRLPYTMAFLQELHRVHTVGPKRAFQDIVYDGYIIPKNTTILLSTGDIHTDPAMWEDAKTFKPERFLDENGNFMPTDRIYPFGLGRRRCPGETLARMFTFITLVTMMQNFSITCAGPQLPTAEPDTGMFASPKPYKAVFVPRHTNGNTH